MLNCGRRLRKELNNLETNKDESIHLYLLDENNILHWGAIITGPPDTPYFRYKFELRIDVGDEYPMTPPVIRFVTKCFHPNVHFETGEICLDILKKEWSPAWNLQSACRAIISLLEDPAADSPLNCDAGNMIRANDMRAFNSVAKMYAIDYGIPDTSPSTAPNEKR